MRILTFDIEDWFHILDNTKTCDANSWDSFPPRIIKNMDLIFDILKRYDQKATFFCLGWIAERNQELIKKIISNGFEIGTHSYSHRLVYEQTPDNFKNDLIKSIAILEDLTGSKIKYYRAPGFSLREDCLWAFDILAEVGIEVDCSLFPAKRNHGGMPAFGHSVPVLIESNGYRMKELPVNIKRFSGLKLIFSGGGYFRLWPYWLIQRMASDSDYLMSYFHPRDFDPDQPRLTMNPSRYFKSYIGLSGAQEKMCNLLRDFSFIDISGAVNLIDWNSVDIVRF